MTNNLLGGTSRGHLDLFFNLTGDTTHNTSFRDYCPSLLKNTFPFKQSRKGVWYNVRGARMIGYGEIKPRKEPTWLDKDSVF